MKLICKALSVVVVGVFTTGVAFAGNTPLLPSTPDNNDPAQTLRVVNNAIVATNAATPGLLAGIPVAFLTTGTAANTVLSALLPGGSLGSGQYVHIHGWGVNSADVNAKTITVTFGSSAVNLVVTGSGNTWVFDSYIQNVGTLAAPVQNLSISGLTAATPVALGNVITTQSLAAAITISVQMTAATAGTMTMNGLSIDVSK